MQGDGNGEIAEAPKAGERTPPPRRWHRPRRSRRSSAGSEAETEALEAREGFLLITREALLESGPDAAIGLGAGPGCEARRAFEISIPGGLT